MRLLEVRKEGGEGCVLLFDSTHAELKRFLGNAEVWSLRATACSANGLMGFSQPISSAFDASGRDLP